MAQKIPTGLSPVFVSPLCSAASYVTRDNFWFFECFTAGMFVFHAPSLA